jgi:hypothetical protein
MSPEERCKIFEAVCLDMETGISLRQASLKNGVDFTTVHSWTKESEATLKRYARARAGMIDAVADQWLTIVDEKPPVIVDESGKTRIDSAGVADKKLRSDARQWYLSKLAPHRYGDSTRLEVDSTEKKVTLTYDQFILNKKPRDE